MADNKENGYAAIGILRTLPPQLVKDYLTNGKFIIKHYKKSEMIHLEGDLCKQVEVIIEGEIAIERIGESGDLMTVNLFRANELIGANLIFSSFQNYPLTITAKKPSKVVIIEKEILFELCNQYPSFLRSFVQIISDLSVLVGTKMKNRVSRTIRESIIIYLNKQYAIQKSHSIQLTMNKKALAERFGVSRTSLCRELQKMKQEGLIQYDAKTVEILDKHILE